MDIQTKALLCSVLVLLTIPLEVQAAVPAHRCAEQVDDAQRLACYDSEFGKPSKTVAREAVAVAAPAAKSEIPAPQKKDTAQPATGAFSITALRRLSDGRYQATLENGEVWAQQEPDPRVEMRVGDSVAVRPAAMGSFMLVTASGGRTRVTRVK